jgi:hypothetical protein
MKISTQPDTGWRHNGRLGRSGVPAVVRTLERRDVRIPLMSREFHRFLACGFDVRFGD